MAAHPISALPNSINAAFWNARWLLSGRDELGEFSNRYELDVILVNETQLRNTHRDPKIPGYILHRRDRPYGPGGGVAIVVAITAIANGIFRLRHFPARWKTANVIFIPKPGKNPKFPQNHRPISLLSTVGKVVAKLIHSRLTKIIDDNRTIPDEQFGFRAHHSTTRDLSSSSDSQTSLSQWHS
jgi:hypothetical protein